MAFKRSAVQSRLSPHNKKLIGVKDMKMSTLRDQSAPVLYGLVILFILAMGGFGNIFNSTNPNRGNSEVCDPELYIACSDDENISITVEEFNRRFNNDIAFWIRQATFNSQFNAIDKQLDTLNAKSRVWSTILNERINNKFISELELIPVEPYSDEMIKFIKNYPNLNSNYKQELESYGLFIVDSIFNQEEYELAVDNGTLDEKINENFTINNPQLAEFLISRGTTRFNNWISTMQRYIAGVRFNYILNSAHSISNLELKDQLLLENKIFNFDYLTFSIDNEINIDVDEAELNTYYESIKDEKDYNLKTDAKRIIEFVKWNSTNLNSEKIDSIKKLAKEFRRTARKDGFDIALKTNNTFSLHQEITLTNDFNTSKSGLASQVLKSDSTKTALYNVIGAGRKIINFAFSNEINEIKLINIESDRETDGFNDIGVFYIKDIIPEGYLSIDESGIKDRLVKEITYKKRYELAKKDFVKLMGEYKKYLIDEGYDNLTDEDLKDFDPLDQWINGSEIAQGKILFRNHNGPINQFMDSFINTDLRNKLITNEEIKALILSLNKGLNIEIFGIDNDNIAILRLNNIPDVPTLEEIKEYKKTELERLATNQSNLFFQDQKETANIKDNRTLVY